MTTTSIILKSFLSLENRKCSVNLQKVSCFPLKTNSENKKWQNNKNKQTAITKQAGNLYNEILEPKFHKRKNICF